MGPSSALAVALCIVACICSLQTAVVATITTYTPPTVPTLICPQYLNITHYTHETRGGPNATFLLTAGTPQRNLEVGAAFGSVIVYNNVMRAGVAEDSEMLGRIPGTAVGVVKPSSTPDNTTRVQLVMQHVFEAASPYNGSTLDVVGIFFFNPPWELAVSGGTGMLRGYTGYGICTPISETALPAPILLVYRWDFCLTKLEPCL